MWSCFEEFIASNSSVNPICALWIVSINPSSCFHPSLRLMSDPSGGSEMYLLFFSFVFHSMVPVWKQKNETWLAARRRFMSPTAIWRWRVWVKEWRAPLSSLKSDKTKWSTGWVIALALWQPEAAAAPPAQAITLWPTVRNVKHTADCSCSATKSCLSWSLQKTQ